MTTIAITGVTGHIGGRVARSLTGRPDLEVRLIARDPGRVPSDIPGERRRADFGDADAVERALQGVDRVLMVSATESADRVGQHRSFVLGAWRAGVGHVVYTSFVGAGDDAAFTLARDHGLTEQALRDTGLSVTFLRDNFYLDVLTSFADASGVIRGPAAQGRTAAVARADVADAAVAVLAEPAGHEGAVYELTGREALTFTEIASRAGRATGRSYRFVDETLEEAYASRRAAYPDAPHWLLDAWVSTYTAIADGHLERVTEDVRRLTGHDPRTLEDVLA